MRIFLAGDIHGNFPFAATYHYPIAKTLGCDAIVQVGDYGFWEHEEDGVEFNDAMAGAALRYGIPYYFLRGNHDNLRLLLARYNDRRTEDGFISIRPGLFHIPDGHVWTWAGQTFRAFGGAYSMDKQARINRELKRDRRHVQANIERRAKGLSEVDWRTAVGTEWFPEEELTDAQMQEFFAANGDKLDIVLSHDKPRAASPGEWWTEKDQFALFNQDRLQRALNVHRPWLWVHGHLHHPYRDTVRHSSGHTQVLGLSCDDRPNVRFWKPTHSWAVLDLHETQQTLYPAWTVSDIDGVDPYEVARDAVIDAAYGDDYDWSQHSAA